MSTPRPEYPRPQFRRKDWLCLNGKWQFEVDQGDSGMQRGLRERPLKDSIIVPFCPESSLSGIGNVDFLNAVWYRRTVNIPAKWKGQRLLLHFQAADYDATVWVNGVEVGKHRGGYSSFTCDCSRAVSAGERATIVVRAKDLKGVAKPLGKQSQSYENQGCRYTRTTGIWQTVWMEPVPHLHLKRARITPDVGRGAFRIEQPLSNNVPGARVRATLSDEKGDVATAEAAADTDFCAVLNLAIPSDRVRLWQPGEGYLYDVRLELLDASGRVADAVDSYAGLRGITIEGKKVKINGTTVFQRLVLDQGYYPDGILTAPTDEALVRDIELSMIAGFNGARLHQKVFEERFLYHADRLGYLVWGEFGDWGVDRNDPKASYVAQWLEVLERDYSHPAIIGWCPLNETAEHLGDSISGLMDLTRALFLATKAMDLSRPVLDTSGYSHTVPEADIYDSHDYEEDPAAFAKRHAGLADDKPYLNSAGGNSVWSIPYGGQPYFVSEFGGTWWSPGVKMDRKSWGYGRRPKNKSEFYARFKGLCDVLLDNPRMFGYCFTQLTDVFQEQNGIFDFNRKSKFDLARIRTIQQRKAAIEKC